MGYMYHIPTIWEMAICTKNSKIQAHRWKVRIIPRTFNLAQKRFFQPVNSQKPRTEWGTWSHSYTTGNPLRRTKSVLSKKLYLFKGLIVAKPKIGIILPKFLSIILSIISKLHQISVYDNFKRYNFLLKTLFVRLRVYYKKSFWPFDNLSIPLDATNGSPFCRNRVHVEMGYIVEMRYIVEMGYILI